MPASMTHHVRNCCGTCEAFHPTDHLRGECRLFPPQPLYDHDTGDYMTMWPNVFSDMWCWSWRGETDDDEH